MSSALILAGHGSHLRPQTAGLVWRHVDRLRALGAADEVTAAFWKEQPSFASVLDTVVAEDVTVVPVFTAEGYFTRTVIPAEMQLDGPVTRRGQRVIRYARSLASSCYLSQIVRQRVEAALHTFALPPDQTAVAIIGHSTRRTPESRLATEAQATTLRAAGFVKEVEAVYLDDAPPIADIYAMTRCPHLIAVPYFLAEGSHTTFDVPAALGLPPGQSHAFLHGRQVVYTAPVGIDDNLIDLILALASEAGAPLPMPMQPATDPWAHFPALGGEALVSAVCAAGTMRFGGLSLSRDHVCRWGDAAPATSLGTPAALRAFVRESPFRSLATSDDLPGGWFVTITRAEQIPAVVETVYPGVVAQWAAQRAGMSRPRSLADVVDRQTGMYRALTRLSAEAQQRVVASRCGACVLHPAWSGDSAGDRPPCCEPCNHWLSDALAEQQAGDGLS